MIGCDRIAEAAANAVAAAFAVVHAGVKGGVPDVPEACRALADGARGYFGAYAHTHVSAANAAVQDLLAGLGRDGGAQLRE